MENPNRMVIKNNLQENDTEEVPAQSVNENTSATNPQGSQEAVSGVPNPEKVEKKGEVLDDLDPEVLAKIVAEVTRTLKDSGSGKNEQENKFFDKVAKRNPKTDSGREDPMLLEEWIRQMEKIFDVVEVPENRRINIGAFYLTGQADIWWRMVKPTFQNDESTWSKFSEALRAKFYPLHLQKQKQKDFLTLRQGSLSVMKYASCFAELSRFPSEFVATDRMKILRFEEGLAPYISNQLAGQHVQTSQELYERAAEIEQVKTELRMANPTNLKRRWDDRNMQTGRFPSKRLIPTKPRAQGIITGKHCTKYGRTNHNTAECRVGTNRCLCCGDPNHMIANCPMSATKTGKGPTQAT